MTCNEPNWLNTFGGQLLALVTFFAYPAIQYVILKQFSKKEGQPELWYLPSFGFRLVIRNIPRKRTLSEIKTKTILRQVIPSSIGSSVNTLIDTVLKEIDDFFLLPGNDLILLSFKLDKVGNEMKFIQTGKLGDKLFESSFQKFEELTTCYTANVENYLNFDIKIAKQITIDKGDLESCWNAIVENNVEQKFTCGSLVDIG